MLDKTGVEKAGEQHHILAKHFERASSFKGQPGGGVRHTIYKYTVKFLTSRPRSNIMHCRTAGTSTVAMEAADGL